MCSKMCYTYVNNMLCSAPIVHPIIHHHIVHSEVPETLADADRVYRFAETGQNFLNMPYYLFCQ